MLCRVEPVVAPPGPKTIKDHVVVQVCIRLGEGDMLTPVVFTSDLSYANRLATLSHVGRLSQGQDPFEVNDPPFGLERPSE